MKKNKVKIEFWGERYRVYIWVPSNSWWIYGPGNWCYADGYYDYDKAKAAAEEMIKFPEYYENR